MIRTFGEASTLQLGSARLGRPNRWLGLAGGWFGWWVGGCWCRQARPGLVASASPTPSPQDSLLGWDGVGWDGRRVDRQTRDRSHTDTH